MKVIHLLESLSNKRRTTKSSLVRKTLTSEWLPSFLLVNVPSYKVFLTSEGSLGKSLLEGRVILTSEGRHTFTSNKTLFVPSLVRMTLYHLLQRLPSVRKTL